MQQDDKLSGFVSNTTAMFVRALGKHRILQLTLVVKPHLQYTICLSQMDSIYISVRLPAHYMVVMATPTVMFLRLAADTQ